MPLPTLQKIIANIETEVPQFSQYINKLKIYEKERGKWYLKSLDSGGREKLVLNEEATKKAPEEIIRQLFIYELRNKYGFPKDRIKIEQTVTFGRGKKKADLIVFQEDNDTPLIVIETKAPNEKNDLEQLKSYLNAKGSPIGVGVNGKTQTIFIRPYPSEFDILPDLPYEHEYQTAKHSSDVLRALTEQISNRDWTLDELNKLNKEKTFDLKAIIQDLEELVLANSGADSFDEIFKLIYAKLYDEFEAEYRDNQRLLFRKYLNPQTTYQEVSALFEEAKEKWKDVFEPTEKIKLTPEHLEIVIGELYKVKLFASNLRIIDEAFEYLIPDVAKSKKGQYFTPRIVIDACVSMINPSRKEYILDPACGSAGFLVHSMEYVWDKYKMRSDSAKVSFAGQFLWGIDFEEKTTKISRALMLIAGDGKSHIYKQNTLDYKRWTEAFKSDLAKERLLGSDNSKQLNFDVILSNPPFAGDIKEKAIINLYYDLLGLRYSVNLDYSSIYVLLKNIADNYEVSFSSSADQTLKEKMKDINKDGEIDLESEDDLNQAIEQLADVLIGEIEEGRVSRRHVIAELYNSMKTKKTESNWSKVERHLLFIQRVIEMLKDGGRAIIVLPQGIFNNSNEKFVRRYITERARILGVIGLHGNTFKPHTGTKTSLLLIRKYSQEEIELGENKKNYPIFFATSRLSFKDNSGRYIYAKDENGNQLLDENGNPIYLTDLYHITEAFKQWGLNKYQKGDRAFEFLTK